jgi:conjugal transfer pilin signal peptidase TrbI
LNQSDSLPQKVFLIIKNKKISRGDYLSFKSSWFNAPLIKEAIGVAGDKIIHDEQGEIWVARKVGKPLPQTKEGKPLHSITPGMIREGYVFAYAPHPRSFDSRYQEVGLVPIVSMIGRAIPLL